MNEITVKHIYPPNFPGTYDSDQRQGVRRHIIQCTGLMDGVQEEEDSVKLRRVDLLTPSGNVPSKLVIEDIEGTTDGLTIAVGYNNADEDVVARLGPGKSEFDFTKGGGFVPQGADDPGGDIVFNTSYSTEGDSYSVRLTVRLKD